MGTVAVRFPGISDGKAAAAKGYWKRYQNKERSRGRLDGVLSEEKHGGIFKSDSRGEKSLFFGSASGMDIYLKTLI